MTTKGKGPQDNHGRGGSGTSPAPAPRRRLPGAPADQGGFMIVLSMLILFTLTLLGMTSLINSTIETKIAANEYNANQSLYAADQGLTHAVAFLNNGTVAPDFANDDWSYPTDSDGNRDTKNEASGDYLVRQMGPTVMYRFYMQFKEDEEDLDGNGTTDELVYFNRAFGYDQSLYTGAAGDDGYPVIEIIADGFVSSAGTSTSTRQSERKLALEIGRNHFNVPTQGAVTSRSTVDLTGTIDVDGRNHPMNATDKDELGGACGSDLPGVFVDTGKAINQGGAAGTYGSPPTMVNPDARPLPAYPWEALGIDEADMPSPIPPASVPDPLSGFVYVNGDVDVAGGTGILVVHNPLFDSIAWDVSDPTSANYNAADPKYDPKLDSTNPAYDAAYHDAHAPANLSMHGNDTFKGVIIADRVDKINGASLILGAVICLTTIEAQHFGNGNAQILYSCEAIANFAQVGYVEKLVWRRM